MDRSINRTKPLTKFGGDRLQTEAQAQADGAGEHGERGQVDSGCVQPDENAERYQEGVGELGEADARPTARGCAAA